MKLEYQRHATGRLFESPFIERSSQVHPATPFVIYLPVVISVLAYALVTRTTTPLTAVASFVVGWIGWQWLEYGIHRGFFHWEGNGPFTRRVHAIAHGYHHKYPDDHKRLVMPLGASLPFALLIAGGFYWVGHAAVTLPLFAGIVSGYLWYDFIHWSTHARPPRTAWGRMQRAHHMAHHFACPDKNFGISHRWIDTLVGSLREKGDRLLSPTSHGGPRREK